MDFGIDLLLASLCRRPELVDPVELTHKARRYDAIREFGTRNLERDDIPNLIAVHSRCRVVLAPLAEVPVREALLGCAV